MAESILPDVFIEVRAEGLIAPAQITVGRMGIIGTSSKGPVSEPVTLSSAADARREFGTYDAFTNGGTLTLVRAIELAYAAGASTVIAVRVSGVASGAPTAKAATWTLPAEPSGTAAVLAARTPGTWANGLVVAVGAATDSPFVSERHPMSDTKLAHKPVVSPRNRVQRVRGASTEDLTITTPAAAGQVAIAADGTITFTPALVTGDEYIASYVVDLSAAASVTLELGSVKEAYTVVDGADLAAQVTASSELVTRAATGSPSSTLPKKGVSPTRVGGTDGTSNADYSLGLETLLTTSADIVVAAGQDAATVGNDLASHCEAASTDALKRERIAVVGSGAGHTLAKMLGTAAKFGSERLIFTVPGIVVRDGAADPPVDVTLPGAYTAAAVGGLISSLPAHVSPTNKTVGGFKGLEAVFNPGQLAQLVESRVLALTERQGLRIVKGITTATNTAFSQITTRRIVDFARKGVRSAATPYIGLLNNTRVRGALRATVNSFLSQMVLDEMLVSYDLDVSATRDEEIQGIARVTMTLRPTFSIDYIKVTMFLE